MLWATPPSGEHGSTPQPGCWLCGSTAALMVSHRCCAAKSSQESPEPLCPTPASLFLLPKAPPFLRSSESSFLPLSFLCLGPPSSQKCVSGKPARHSLAMQKGEAGIGTTFLPLASLRKSLACPCLPSSQCLPDSLPGVQLTRDGSR